MVGPAASSCATSMWGFVARVLWCVSEDASEGFEAAWFTFMVEIGDRGEVVVEKWKEGTRKCVGATTVSFERRKAFCRVVGGYVKREQEGRSYI